MNNTTLVDTINALTEDTKSNVLNWTRENDSKYIHSKPQYGKMTLEAAASPKRFVLTVTDASAKPTQKMKATSDQDKEVSAALESLWRAVTDDYGNDGVKFLSGFVKPKTP